MRFDISSLIEIPGNKLVISLGKFNKINNKFIDNKLIENLISFFRRFFSLTELLRRTLLLLLKINAII